MMKKIYIRPIIKVFSLHTGPLMNLSSYRQAPISTDIQTTDDDQKEYWGF